MGLQARPVKGTRWSAFYPSTPEDVKLSSIDSAFQLQEYIAALIRLDPHNVDRIVTLPGADKTQSDEEKSKSREGDEESDDKGIDENCWIYEQLRRLSQDLTHPLITTLQQECTRESCPEMKAGEWLYLCVAHGNGGTMEQCCAIDYVLHTLDSATALLNSPHAFPSRISIPAASHRHFGSLARRLSRIFAHAYHHHRDTFEQAEAETALYARFLAIATRFELVPVELLTIKPGQTTFSDAPEAEAGRGSSSPADPTQEESSQQQAAADAASTGEFQVPSSPPVSRNPPGGRSGRPRTDTMFFSGDLNIPVPSPRSGSGALGLLGDEGESSGAPRDGWGTVKGLDLSWAQHGSGGSPSRSLDPLHLNLEDIGELKEVDLASLDLSSADGDVSAVMPTPTETNPHPIGGLLIRDFASGGTGIGPPSPPQALFQPHPESQDEDPNQTIGVLITSVQSLENEDPFAEDDEHSEASEPVAVVDEVDDGMEQLPKTKSEDEQDSSDKEASPKPEDAAAPSSTA